MSINATKGFKDPVSCMIFTNVCQRMAVGCNLTPTGSRSERPKICKVIDTPETSSWFTDYLQARNHISMKINRHSTSNTQHTSFSTYQCPEFIVCLSALRIKRLTFTIESSVFMYYLLPPPCPISVSPQRCGFFLWCSSYPTPNSGGGGGMFMFCSKYKHTAQGPLPALP